MECFTIYADEIEGRLDPFYYKPEFREFDKKINNCKWEIKQLKEICEKIKTGKGIYNFNKEGELFYINVNNIFENEIKFNQNFKIVNEKKFSNVSKKNNILTGRVGSIGNFALNQLGDILISDNILNLEFSKKRNVKFFLYVLNSRIIKTQINKLLKGSLQRVINQQSLNSLKIPVPPLAIQNHIVALMDKAYSLKKSKETEAKKLLDSINDYVLDELGIKLPELEDKMTYIVSSEEVKSNRADPRYYKPHFKEFENELNKRKDIKTIGELSEYVGSGATPKAGGEDYTSSDEGIPFVRIVNLKNNTVVLDDVLYIKKSIHENMLKRTQLKANDVLLSMAGTIGLSVVVPKDLGEANINQAIARIVVKDNVNPFYLSAILNSKIGKIQTDRLSRPAVQSNINLEEIRALKIPLPPLAIQNKIAEEVKKRMQKAEQLQKEAKEELEKAKQEVEKIILGE